MHLVNSFMNLYSCLLDEIAAQEHAEGADRMSSSQVCIRHHHVMYLSCLKQIQNCTPQVFHIVRYAVLFDEFRLSSPARCGRLYCKIKLWVSVRLMLDPLYLFRNSKGDRVHCYSMKHSPNVECLLALSR